jgi:cAMP-dependent protein kinase regulator
VLPDKLLNKHRGPRASVSAEAFGTWNQKGLYKPKVVEKTAEQKAALRKKLDMAFMFSALDEKEKEVVIDAMTEVKADTGDVVIKQGD